MVSACMGIGALLQIAMLHDSATCACLPNCRGSLSACKSALYCMQALKKALQQTDFRLLCDKFLSAIAPEEQQPPSALQLLHCL